MYNIIENTTTTWPSCRGNSVCECQSTPQTHQSPAFTCGKHYVSGHQFVVDNGKLRQLDARHPRYSRVASFPVELDVICGVAICGRRSTHTPRCNHLSNPHWRPRYAVCADHPTGLSFGKRRKTRLKSFLRARHRLEKHFISHLYRPIQKHLEHAPFLHCVFYLSLCINN